MTRHIMLTSTLAAMLLAGCTTLSDLPTERLGSAKVSFANGVPAGTAQLLANGDQLSLAVAVTGISEGEHGFHLHSVGLCKGPDFSSAGGHLNPSGKQHGSLNPQGSHLGDMPNLSVGKSRSASTTIDLEGDRAAILASIFDADGTAIVIHASADDYLTDPAGDAGSRIACGTLQQL